MPAPTDAAPRAPLAMGLADYAGLLFLALVWGSSFTLIKVAVDSVPPISMAAGRMLVAALLLALVLLARGERFPPGLHPWGVFAVVGVLGNAMPFALIAFGERSVDSGLAAILMGSMPVATAVLAHVAFADERLTARRIAGVAVGFGGVVTLVGWDALAGLGAQLIAQLAVLGGAVCYALTTLFVRRYGSYPHLATATGATLVGALALAPFALAIDRPWTLQPTPQALGAVVVLGALPTGVAALVYFALVRRIGAGNFSQVNYLVPAIGVLWGVFALGERPGAGSVLALALILAGVWLVTARR